MLRLGKLTDYAAIILGHLAVNNAGAVSSSDIARATRIPAPTVAKILKTLGRAGMVQALRGANGGYQLALDTDNIAVLDIIEVMEGPIALTTCLDEAGERCVLEGVCAMQSRWGPVNAAIRNILGELSLADLLNMDKDHNALTTIASSMQEGRNL